MQDKSRFAEWTRSFLCFVNGKQILRENIEPAQTLLSFLRNDLGLTGTKLGCGEGACGACTVTLSSYDICSQKVVHKAINACLAPLASVHGCSITTVEGIGSSTSSLHPIQERIAIYSGSQCGFCTPGIVMSMYSLLCNKPAPSSNDIEDAFDGNLCRCTGYRPILSAFQTFTTAEMPQLCASGKICTSSRETCANTAPKRSRCQYHETDAQTRLTGEKSNNPFLCIEFPPELKSPQFSASSPCFFPGKSTDWYRPSTLNDVLEMKHLYPNAKLICGNTEVGIETKFKNSHYPIVIYCVDIPELSFFTVGKSGLELGASLCLSKLMENLSALLNEYPEQKLGNVRAILEILHLFAGTQIRNVGAVAGNIATASPISDLNPLLMAMGSILTIRSKRDGIRKIPLSQFFLGYRKTALKSHEIIVSITIPFTDPLEFIVSSKQAKRRHDDIAIVNSALRVVLEKSGPQKFKIQTVRLCFGGMAATSSFAKHAESFLLGKIWSQNLVTPALEALDLDFPLDKSSPGGMAEYRKSLAASFLFKFFMIVSQKISSPVESPPAQSFTPTQREISRGKQTYADIKSPYGAPGSSLIHVAAKKQASGEAIYCDDIPRFVNEVYGALVLSTVAHAEIEAIDASEALKLPGVIAFVSSRDVFTNEMFQGARLEECFASKLITCVGQHLGVIVAENYGLAQKAAKLVKVACKVLKPVLSIEEAVSLKQYFFGHHPLVIQQGDLSKAFKEADYVEEGEIRCGGQDHFYLETNCTIAIPKNEDNEIEIISSTQNPSATQFAVAQALGIPAHKVICRTKRLGGGFGGKETRSIQLSCAIAAAAKVVGRPVRCMLDRDEDMISTGGRHPFLCRFSVAFQKNGKFCGLKASLYNNAGNYLDLSAAVMERALFHIDNCYKFPAISVEGHVCRTNLPSNTAFRGFGAPQGMFITEAIVHRVARRCGLSDEAVRELNLYQENDLTHFNQALEGFHIPRMWRQLQESCQFSERVQEIERFNASNRWIKRGISLVPTKFGISFTALFYNQAGALVHCYKDGSVLLAHGGVEMGQGLHTKMIQVAAHALGIDASKVHIWETSTSTVANTSPTAASASSDLNGMAILDACRQINERLAVYKGRNPHGSFEEWVYTAHMERVNLSANGFYATPDIGYTWGENVGKPFNYFTYGVACSEVQIDTLTGHFEPLRTDIVMDLGKSLNPVLDVGQIEGAFVQGLGLFTTEDPVWSPQGVLLSRGPGTYKIPDFKSIPVVMNVSLLKDSENPRAIHSSKAVGEPPLFLAVSTFCAIREAVHAARKEEGHEGYFRFDSPATCERIRMACLDQITSKYQQHEGLSPTKDPTPLWNITV